MKALILVLILGSCLAPLHAGELTPADRVALDAVDWAAVREEAADLTSRYLRIPSVSGQEEDAARFLLEEAARRGLPAERFDTGEGKPNVLVSTAPERAPSLLFMTHLDVVPADDAGWKHPPFSGARAEGAVWGRGAGDTKGLSIVHLLVMSLLKRIDPDFPHPVALLSVAQEEVGGLGSKWMIEHAKEKLGKSVVFSEGGAGVRGIPPVPDHLTLFPIASAEKSTLWLRLSLLIDGGHASSPPPEYASRQMVLALNRLLEAHIPIRVTPETERFLQALAAHMGVPARWLLRNPNWPVVRQLIERAVGSSRFLTSVLHDTLTLTRIETDSRATNVIPRRVEAYLDCRLLPGTAADAFIERIRGLLDDDRITIEIVDQSPQAAGSRIGPVFEAIREALRRESPDSIITPYLSPTSSDGNLFRAAGHDVYGIFPSLLTQEELDGIHGVNERIQERSLEEATRAFLEMVLRLRRWSGPD